jgi:hypothetical protein
MLLFGNHRTSRRRWTHIAVFSRYVPKSSRGCDNVMFVTLWLCLSDLFEGVRASLNFAFGRLVLVLGVLDVI